MLYTRRNYTFRIGLAVLAGIIIVIGIGLGIALYIQMTVLSVELIIPGTAVYY